MWVFTEKKMKLLVATTEKIRVLEKKIPLKPSMPFVKLEKIG